MPEHPLLSDLTISDVAFGGQGVARHEGKVVFVPFTVPGEKITARVRRAKKAFVEAELVEVTAPSADRVEPACPYFRRCGGCAYQHIDYARQLTIKAGQVEQTIRRLGRLTETPMRPTEPSPREYAYRNRIRVHVEGGRAGFYAHGSHAIVEINECVIASPEVNEELRRLRSAMPVDGDYTLFGKSRAEYFEQTNDGAAEALLGLVEAAVGQGGGLLVDAYCGAGFFARRLAAKFSKVIGIEENARAVDRAQRDAAAHERYIAGDVAVHLGEVLSGHDPKTTTVILDPPAAGLAPRVTDLLLGDQPAVMVYISCNPATLARDLGELCRTAYRLESVTPLDMFPQTAEIEVVAKLVRR